jgi:DNA-binding FrmR family transcriptional regulator
VLPRSDVQLARLKYPLGVCSLTGMDTPGYHDHKADYLKRLRRIEGQVRGLQRMVDEDVYCIDILTQVSAVKSALQSVSVGLVEDHLGHCVQDAVAGAAAGGDDGRARAEEKVAEASAAITRLLKS